MALQEEFEKQGIWLFRYRGILPVIILFIGLAIFLWAKLHPGTYFLDGTNYEIYYVYLCLAISLFGLVIRAYTVGHTPDNTSGRNVKEQIADSLNTTGIYSTVRHPLYLGNFFMWLGAALLTGNLWFVVAFCFFYWVYYERIMFAEEQFLRRKFVTAYTEWAERVPAFIPKCKIFVKPNLPFSWKKVMKKEKNGLAAVFIIFSAFDIAGNLIQHKTNFNYAIHIACAVSILLYLVLRYMKRRTGILN
ncbi:MAG: isoprenylcysteine carboxylmethyltransferase family protein [bacterium]